VLGKYQHVCSSVDTLNGEHFKVAGFYYTGEGKPLKAHIPTPTIAAIVR